MPTTDLLTRLLPNQRRGSKPRCHLLTHGDDAEVAARLTALVAQWGHVRPGHVWLPRGFEDTTEAKLGETPGLLSDEHREEVLGWWLEVRRKANTPNWDIASTCDIQGQTGLILVEAKAHLKELSGAGKPKPRTTSGWKNHERIGKAIREANKALTGILSGWELSRDSHYQLCNRFAWSWKVASLGVPVILVYLGFLNAEEMADQGKPFHSTNEWGDAIRGHAHGIVPDWAWNTRLEINSTSMCALIRAVDLRWVLSGEKDGGAI